MGRFIRLLVILSLLAGLSVLAPVTTAEAAGSWTVCASGCDFTSITGAIAAGSVLPGDTINVQAGTYNEHAIEVSKNLSIIGAGSSVVTVDAQHLDRVFHIPNGVTATISGMTITNGQVTGLYGAGILEDGATLTMNDVILTGNSGMGSGNVVSFGGGISNAGTLTMTNRQIVNNSSYFDGGGMEAYFGSTTHLTNVLIQGNTITGPNGSGAGIAVNSDVSPNSSTLTLDHVTVSGNTGGNSMAGMFIQDHATATITDSTVSNNGGTSQGIGGIYIGLHSTLTMSNSTLSGNDAGTQAAGGLFISSTAAANLTNVPMFANTASNGGGIDNQGTLSLTNSTLAGNGATGSGGGILNFGALSMANTIVANSASGGDCSSSGTISINLNDLVEDGSCSTALSGDPQLGPLADNGGATKTMALLSGSPAIDAGEAADCPATDQRGVPRPLDGNGDGSAVCDIGAYEHSEPSTTLIGATTPSVSTINQEVPVTVTVTGSGSTPTGTVSIGGADSNCVITLSAGMDTCNVVFGSYGSKTLTATYNGDLAHSQSNNSQPHVVAHLLVFNSQGINDGWVLESSRTSSVGGSLDSTKATIRVGDDSANRQYRGILSFNTSGLPDTASVIYTVLSMKKAGITGTNPFTTHGGLLADIRKPYFGAGVALAIQDFQALPSKAGVGSFVPTPTNGWYSVTLRSAAFPYVNRLGTTQFRLRFKLGDNGDNGADYLSFYSGNATSGMRPALQVYYTP